MLVIEHNLRLVMGLCQHLTVLDHGLTIAAGDAGGGAAAPGGDPGLSRQLMEALEMGKQRFYRFLLLSLLGVFVWSFHGSRDRLTWYLEAAPVIIALFLLAGHSPAFSFYRAWLML